MSKVQYDGQTYPVAPGETVLSALLNQGVEAAHSCKAGACGACMMRAVEGMVPAKAQSGLKDSWKAQGYFLPCVCLPEQDMVITKPGDDAQIGASISALEKLSADVLRVRVRCDRPIAFRAGQYVTIMRDPKLARSYSIASLPNDCDIEIHVRRVPGGRMSGWIHEVAKEGDRVTVLGPSGDCFYVPGNEEQPLLLVGTGTGLAPLYGILLDALEHGHRGLIHLFHGAVHQGGLYLVDELQRLAAAHSQVKYTPAVLKGEEVDGLSVGSIEQVVLRQQPKLHGWRAFLCGDPAIVQLLRKKVFLAGAASRDIYADAFLPAA